MPRLDVIAMAVRRGGARRERGRDKDIEEEARNKNFFRCGSESEASAPPDVRQRALPVFF
jgi:hypothetical protein